jgi:hypothetical protein
MSKTPFEENLEARADLFQALGHPVRLMILNLVRMRPRHGEELALVLDLTPATVSHHLAKLTAAGLLQAQKDQYYQTYTPRGEWLGKTLGEMIRLPQEGLVARVDEGAYRRKVLRAFFRRGRLVRIPAQLKKRQIILERIVACFEPDRDYPQQEVNRILLEFHEDVATLRREMIANKLMRRARGIYRRTASRT